MSSGNPDGGADLLWGTGVCTIYLKPFESDQSTSEDGTSFGVKVVLHEYFHCLQHGLVSGDVDPSVRYDTIDVSIEDGCGVNDLYHKKTLAAINNMPAEYKLVKKVVVFYACGKGTEYTSLDLQDIAYGFGCPGMDPLRTPVNNLNGIGEGDAEYYAQQILMPAIQAADTTNWDSSYATPYNGVTEWNNRGTDAQTACGFKNSGDDTAKDNFVIGDLSEDHVDSKMIPTLSDAGKDTCRNNYIGEAAFRFILATYSPSLSNVLKMWQDAGSVGIASAFETNIGVSWNTFTAAFEKSATYLGKSSSDGYDGQAHGSDYDMEELVYGFAIVATLCCLMSAFFLMLCVRNVWFNPRRIKRQQKQHEQSGGVVAGPGQMPTIAMK